MILKLSTPNCAGGGPAERDRVQKKAKGGDKRKPSWRTFEKCRRSWKTQVEAARWIYAEEKIRLFVT